MDPKASVDIGVHNMPDKENVVVDDRDFAGWEAKAQEHGWESYTKSEERKVIRRIDFRIIPFLWGYTVLSAVDKIIISNAALYGMKTDTHLVGQDYSWVGSIFYFGYLVAEFPSTWLLSRFPIGKFLTATSFGWSICTLLMACTSNPGGLMALRFIMGMFEAPGLATCTLITVIWYTKTEQPLRVAVWSATFASVYVSLLSYGIGHSTSAIASWRLLFLVLGSVSFALSVLMLFFLPDHPTSPRFLKDKEVYIALQRLRLNNTGDENKTFKLYQVREALLDWKSWVITLFFICMNVPNGGLNTFSAQIVSGFGFGTLTTTLLGMPTGVVQALSSMAATIPSRYFKNTRCFSAAFFCMVPLICSIVIRVLPSSNQGGRLAAYYCFYCFWGPYAIALSLPMANTSGHTKKITVNAMVFTAYCVANIIAPQTFRTSQAPGYKSGYNSIVGFEAGAIFLMLVYFVGVQLENKRRDRKQGDSVPVPESPDDDLTDWEKPNFRYIC
ncbi:allantoate permease-2 [Coleophoma crateriformis]|uniref:Allantoate permease-2 n=1 Tax=Coleophoma crateriformis TaxID=565419 RepID=A0A3D8SGM1_9HELO|nr:allantoate permease-2 [Coleophoma crateriformis]